MKCTIPEISWHNRDPVLSVDIQPVCVEDFYRLASGGTDCHVLIWLLKIRENGAVDSEAVSDLKRHQRAVNVVRWSPSGQYLATGDDDANIIIWNLKTDNIPLLEGETNDKEIWIVNKVLRGHKEDVYDICWSPDGAKLISGSIDNTAILWNFFKGQNECILTDHKGFVQGVTWDPKGQYIATLSSDRMCRTYDNTGRNVRSRTHKGILPVPESHVLFNREMKYFHDDTFKSYFRRLSFSPDGNLLIAPSGCIEAEDYKEVRHATFIFSLDCLTQPVAMLPSPKQVTIAVRCCPVLFELRSEAADPVIALPYRMVIAVATDSDVILYDTQQLAPFAHFRKIHYTRITDLTWSADGLLLIASSTDGFCTLITFEPEELGLQYMKEDSEPETSILDVSACEDIDMTEIDKKKKDQPEIKIKKPNMLEKWTVRKSKTNTSEEAALKLLDTPDQIKEPVTLNSNVQKAVVKRIVPIKIADIQKPTKTVTENEKSITNIEAGENTEEHITNKDVSLELSDGSDNDVTIISDSSDHSISQKEQPSSKIKHRSSNAGSKKKQTPTKTNILLKFLQTGSSKKKHSQTNAADKYVVTKLGDSEIIEINDDQSSSATNETCEPPVHKASDLENAGRSCSQPREDDVMNIDSDTDVEKDVGSTTKINTVTSEISLESELITEGDEIKISTKPILTEKENLETKEVPSTDVLKTSSDKPSIIHTEAQKSVNAIPKPAIKIPRRIPFVTLSSPKRKKKE